MQLDNETIKRLKSIGHELKPIVMIGNKGITPAISEEIDRALSDHELIKVKVPTDDREEKTVDCDTTYGGKRGMNICGDDLHTPWFSLGECVDSEEIYLDKNSFIFH